MSMLNLTIHFGGIKWSNVLGSEYNNKIRRYYRFLREEGVSREDAKHHCVAYIHYT